MQCCSPHARSAGKFFSRFAGSYRRRFTRKGFEDCQQQMLAGIQQAGFKDTTLLEIGCGVGQLHMHLLDQGASSAVGVDLAPTMIDEARAWASDRGLDTRTDYHVGDFMLMDNIAPADITLMDKVICCYPDVDGLVHRSLAATQRVYALTYPRNTWLMRSAVKIGSIVMKLIGSDFRPYVHDPEQVEQWVRAAGFDKTYQNHTFIWLSQVYSRPATASS